MTSSSERRAASFGSFAAGSTSQEPASAAGATRRPSASERLHGRAAASAAGTTAAASATASSAHARFIPREELRDFAAWAPSSFGGTPGSASPAAQPPAEPPLSQALLAKIQAARQAGYQDGYRDGLVALDAFKQSYANQLTAQMSTLTQAYRTQLEQLEHGLASQVAEVAIALAQQVVRSELATQPALVAAVAQEALGAALVSAQCIALHLHPDDCALVRQHAGEALAARGARLLPDPSLSRGGCVVDTEVGVIDASIEARWRRATAAMGRAGEWVGATDSAVDSDAALAGDAGSPR